MSSHGNETLRRPGLETGVSSGYVMALRGWVANDFPHGTVHLAGDDLQSAVRSDSKLFGLWERLTPLGRNEFICWIEDAKQPSTRQRRIRLTCEELMNGKKRPCCWAGCVHRTDKAPGRWQQAVLMEGRVRSGR
jgi:hypothetical protein